VVVFFLLSSSCIPHDFPTLDSTAKQKIRPLRRRAGLTRLPSAWHDPVYSAKKPNPASDTLPEVTRPSDFADPPSS